MNKEKLVKLRCKAWGITEDEYYCNQCSDFSLEDMARAYRRGKNKGASDIAIQNGRFYQKQMQDIYDKKNKQIADLEDKLANADYQLEGRDNEIRELKEKIEKMKCTLKKIIKTVQNDNISGYGDRLVKIYDISCEVLQELEK